MRYTFAILKLMSLRTLVYFALLYSFFIESIHTGAAYSNCGNIAPLYIIFSASSLSPQLIVADLDRAFINLYIYIYVCVCVYIYIHTHIMAERVLACVRIHYLFSECI